MTAVGPVQFGVPPETIKDHMSMGVEVPRYYVVPSTPFLCSLGWDAGVNVAECEFPAYFNYFLKKKQVCLIVDSPIMEHRMREVFQQTLLGPREIDLSEDFAPSVPRSHWPDLEREMKYFQVVDGAPLTVDRLIRFLHFNEMGYVTIPGDEAGGIDVHIARSEAGEYWVVQDGLQVAAVPELVRLPEPRLPPISNPFAPPGFGLTVLGNSHGFDPAGRTSGFVLWIDGRGIMIDPPANSTAMLRANSIHPSQIDGVIVTHCHADHDAGTFQKMLQACKVTLITTTTIMRSFVRKYSALSGFTEAFTRRMFRFRPVRIGEPVRLRGAEFRFFYSLHSIPCIGFEVQLGGKGMVFSADHMYIPNKIQELHTTGVLSDARRDQLLNFPWHHDIILHEAGVPPIHTPLSELQALPADVRQRLYVVHTTQSQITPDTGLKGARAGVEHSLVLTEEVTGARQAALMLDLLSQTSLFRDMPIDVYHVLLELIHTRTYQANEHILSDGDPSPDLFVVLRGKVLVEERVLLAGAPYRPSMTSSPFLQATPPPTRSKLMTTVRKVGEGAVFGLSSLVDFEWSHSAVQAETDVEVACLSSADVDWVFRRTPILARIRRLATVQRAGSWTAIVNNPTLKQLTPEQQMALEQCMDIARPSAGDRLVEHGTSAPFSYLARTGTYTITTAEKQSGTPSRTTMHEKALAVGREGGGSVLFCDVPAILSESTCRHSLRCDRPGLLFRISNAELSQFFASNPGVALALLNTGCVN